MNYLSFFTTLGFFLLSIQHSGASVSGSQELNARLLSELHAESLFYTELEQIKNNENEFNESILFSSPPGWRFAEKISLPASVKALVVGKGKYDFPPSLNLGLEVYKGTLKQYLKRVKKINDDAGNTWKDLGTIRTKAGNASLSQVDKRTQWGEVKMMHVIFQERGITYIMTAAALKEEFPRFYKDFFNSFCSIHFEKNCEELH